MASVTANDLVYQVGNLYSVIMHKLGSTTGRPRPQFGGSSDDPGSLAVMLQTPSLTFFQDARCGSQVLVADGICGLRYL